MHRTAFLAPLAALILAACAQTGAPASEYERLQAETPWENSNGRETREIVLGGGVVILQERSGDRISSTGIDGSGLGAVTCSWRIYMGMYAGLALCGENDEEWRGELSAALDRINDFIVANSLTPVAKRNLEDEISKQISQLKDRAVAKHGDDTKKICEALEKKSPFPYLKKMGIDKFHAEVDKLLSAPRPPVMNPCL